MAISSQEEFREVINKMWLSEAGLSLTKDLEDGTLIEEFYEDKFRLVVKKRESKWLVEDGPAKEFIHARLFYYGDVCEQLVEMKSEGEFATKFVEFFGEKKIVFLPLTAPEVLVMQGFADFAERMGLPSK